MSTAGSVRAVAPPDGVIRGVLERALVDRFGAALRAAAPGVRERVGALAAAALERAPEYTSLLTGTLRGQLGVVSAGPVLARVARNLADGCRVTVLAPGRAGGSLGGMRVELVKGDYSEVLGAGGAFTSEGGHPVDWLRWLTLEGDRIIVVDYHFYAGRAGSRTGQGIMEPTGVWRVPPEHAGTAADNWVLRALLPLGPEAAAALRAELARAL